MAGVTPPARWRVLIASVHIRRILPRFLPLLAERKIEVIVPEGGHRFSESEMLTFMDETVDGVVCSDDPITEPIMARATRLKVISKWGVGVDAIDREAARRRGIRVCNSPGAFSDAAADVVMAYLLCFARPVHQVDALMRQGKWEQLPGVSLRGKTLGVIGIGDIGREVVQRARPFGLRLLGRDIREIDRSFCQEMGLTMVQLDELLCQSDYVSLNCDLNPTSFHLIGEYQLRAMKPTAVLINTARGPIVDERALGEALEQRRIAGAALDVFEDEPLPATSPLRRFPNVLLAPHNAYNTVEAVERVHEQTIHNLIAGLEESSSTQASKQARSIVR
jgi:phosphoglycerate dehydrogenase-like enzyme